MAMILSMGNHGQPSHSSHAAPAELASDNQPIADLASELRAAREEIARLREDVQDLKDCTLLYRWQRFTSHRLSAAPQYSPRPLNIPPHYRHVSKLSEPPTIAIVTPSFRQGHFLERTLRSVLDQDYPRLQYAVQDGGSQDETVEILERYDDRLTHWASQADRGQAHAINLGFQRVTGEIMAYLNSDDLLLPGALHYVADYFHKHPNVDAVYGQRILIDEDDHDVGRWILPRHEDETMGWMDIVPQETWFWRRRIWERAGSAFDENLQFALDWDMKIRMRAAGARFVRLPRFLGAFRLHTAQKTSTMLTTRGEREIQEVRKRAQGRPVLLSEVGVAVRRYLRRHVLLRHMYRFGLVRY